MRSPTILPPDPNPKKPAFKAPPLSCDAHTHIFGPGDQYPYAADASYIPHDCGLDKFRQLHEQIGIERASSKGAPFHDAVPFGAKLVETIPDRVLWGTDWPHPNVSVMPNDGELVDLIPLVAPTADLQKKLLVDNPARLYRF